jgi:ABC-type transporter Mla subunit MlaD
MKRRLSDYLVALAVIACSVVLLGALTLALTGYRVNKNKRILHIRFVDVAGVRLHTEVRYAGAMAGRVVGIRPLTTEERLALPAEEQGYAVMVDAEIDDHVPAIPADATASLASETLLSEKFVALSAGTAGGEVLADGAAISARSGGSLDDLISSAGPVLTEARDLIVQLQRDLGTVAPEAVRLLEELKTTAKSADSLVRRAEKLIADNEGNIGNALVELQKVLGDLQTVADNANGLIDGVDSGVDRRMQELGVVLQNLKVVTTHAKAITETLAEKPSRLIWGGKPVKVTPEAEILRSNQPVPARRP